MKILIVEDDSTSQFILSKILGQYGECRPVNDGREAISAFAEALDQGEPFDLICLDLMMPVMNGHQTLAEIRSFEDTKGRIDSDRVKVIIISALCDEENIFKAYRGECEAYLVKPIEHKKIAEALHSLGLIPAP